MSPARRFAFALVTLLACVTLGPVRATRAGISDGLWIEHPMPATRYEHATAVDEDRGLVYAFGGTTSAGDGSEVVELTLGPAVTWRTLHPEGAPPAPRSGSSAIFDPVNRRVIVFGGVGTGGLFTFNDVWELSLAAAPTWRPLSVAGTAPVARYGHTAVYDPAAQRMIVFGGQQLTPTATRLNDVWSLSLGAEPTWAPLTPGGTPPSIRAQHGAVRDPLANQMLVFGGVTGASGSTVSSELWSLSLGASPTWTLLSGSGEPSARGGCELAFDAARSRLIVSGGAAPVTAFGTTWAWSTSTSSWSMIGSFLPPGGDLRDFSLVVDAAHDRLVIFAGYARLLGPLNTLHTSPLAPALTWTNDAIPPASDRPLAVHDAARDRMLTFLNGQAWSFDLGWNVWSKLNASGPTPPGTNMGVLDVARDRLLLYAYPTLWKLDLSGPLVWDSVTTLGPRPNRLHAAVVLDAPRDRLILHGGAGFGLFNDTWVLSLSGTPTWSELTTSGTPPTVYAFGAVGVLDPPRDRLVVCYSDADDTGDLWELSLGTTPQWARIPTTGALPKRRIMPSMALDAARDRVVVFGGLSTSNPRETWECSLGSAPTWTLLAPNGAPPTPRQYAAAIVDPTRNRMVIFGGGTSPSLNDTWSLYWGDVLGVRRPVAPGALAVTFAGPNPGRRDQRFVIEGASGTSLAAGIFSVQGRRVWKSDVRVENARAVLDWNGRDETGRPVAPGVYFLRAVAGAKVATRRIVRLP